MKLKSVRLLGLAFPLMFLPLMSFAFSEVPGWFEGSQGRSLISQLLSQILEGIAGALIQVFTFGLFGAQLPAA